LLAVAGCRAATPKGHKPLYEVVKHRYPERGLSDIRLSAGARNVIKQYHWPGNIRELENVLVRVATYCDRVEIRSDDVRQALQLTPVQMDTEILNRPFSENFSLGNVLDEVARHYIERARERTGDRITRTPKLLDYEHYQVLSRKIKGLGLGSTT